MDDGRFADSRGTDYEVPYYPKKRLGRVGEIRISDRWIYLRVREIVSPILDAELAPADVTRFVQHMRNKRHMARTDRTAIVPSADAGARGLPQS
jgi:hypothetical protein